MKKLFTFLLLGCAAMTVSAQQQFQIPNGDFEGEWVDCIPWTSKNNTKNFGTQPKSWHVSHVYTGIINYKVAEEINEGNNKAIKLINNANSLIIEQNIPAYITLGTPWSTSETGNNSDGGTFGGMEFRAHPDAISFRYQRDNSKGEERASAIAYLWKGSWTQKDVPGNIAIGGSATTVDMVDRDRCVLGMSITDVQGGELDRNSDGVLIASGQSYYSEATTTWTDGIIELDYGAYENQEIDVEKINVIFSANDYFADRSKIVKDNSFSIDDVTLLYYHALKALSYEGATISFDENILSYDLSDIAYDASKLSYIKKGQGATVTTSFNEGTGVLTIRVEAEDYNAGSNADAYTEYTVQFKAPIVTEYTNTLLIDVLGNGFTAPSEATIQLIEETDGSYSFLLPDFSFSEIPVGDIKVTNLKRTEEGDVVTFTGSQSLTILEQINVTANLEATETNGIMRAYITIPEVQGQVYFSPELTINSETAVEDDLNGLYNVTINRSFPAGWSTICLPFATTVEALGATQAQEFTDFANNTLEFTKVSTGEVAANTPYLIHFEQAKDLSAAPIYAPMTVESSTPKAVTFGDVTFTGNYTAGMSMEGYYGVADRNGSQYIMKGGSNSTLGSTGAYFSVAGAAAEVNRLALDLEGVTAIGSVETEGAEDAFDVYSISGVKVRTGATNLDGLQRGLYIVNGKKVLVK